MSFFATKGKRFIHYNNNGDIIKIYDKLHVDVIKCICLSAKDELLISGSYDGKIIIWDVETGNFIKLLRGHNNYIIYGIAVTTDSSTIISGGGDNTIKIWDLETGLEKNTLRGHMSVVHTVAATPNNDKVVSGSWDNTIRVWNIDDGTLLLTFIGHKDFITSIIITPDGENIISGSCDGTVQVWNLFNDTNTKKIYVGTIVFKIVFAAYENKVVCGCGNASVRIYNMETSMLEFVLTGHKDWISSVALSPDGQHILSGSYDTTIKQWNLSTGNLEHTVENNDIVWSVVYSNVVNDVAGCMKSALKLY